MSRGRAQSGDRLQKHFGRDWIDFESSSNRGGWLVTYADMMTIILTFMILLLSVSTIAQTKFDLLVEALTGRKVGNLHKVQKKIDEVIEKASLGGQVTTSIDEDGLKIQFANALLFPSGKATLTEEGVDIFKPIAAHLVHDLEPAYGVTIEGYSDDVPIDNERFTSNWELSTSRSIHVMRRLVKEGFNRRRMSVQGFADTRSATDIDLHDPEDVESLAEERLEEVRAKNRRVVIRINRLDRDVLRDIYGETIDGASERGSRSPPNEGEGSGSEGAGAESTENSGSESDGGPADESGIEVLEMESSDTNSAEEQR